VGEARNAYRHPLLRLVQCGTGGKCPSLRCKDFFVTFWNVRLSLCLIFSSTILSISCHSNIMRQARQGRCLNHNQCHTPIMQCKRIRCRMYSGKNKRTRTKFKCQECDIGLCATPCFELSHTKLLFSGPADTKVERQSPQIRKYYPGNCRTDIFQ
jgi:hypothetical protein